MDFIPVLLTVIVLVFGGLLAVIVLPQCFFRYAVLRRHPWPDTKAFRKREEYYKTKSNPYWIDTVQKDFVEIKSFDGLILKAFFKKAPLPTNKTMFFLHGYTGEGRQLSPIAQYIFEKHGYNILMPHQRAHGHSEGKYIGFGLYESHDCIQWIEWIKKETAGNGSRIALLGTSMGAAAILLAAASPGFPKEVRMMVEDCGYTSAKDELLYQMYSRFHIKSELLFDRINEITRKKAGYSFYQAAPVDVIDKINLPILFVHGEADTFTPIYMMYKLYETAVSEKKDILPVKGAGHGESYKVDPVGYQGKLDMFLAAYMND